jgi:DNA-directed RNA polymerase II subunit RPB1
MNLHAPQSVEAATELREIAAVPLQIVSPRESVPIVSVVQDTLVGANRFARPDRLFTLKESMNLLIHAKRWDGNLPAPTTTDPQPLWSGQQLLSALLPPVSLKMKNDLGEVEIAGGQIIKGLLDKKVFSKQLIHIIYNDYGAEATVDFLDSLQAMIASFLMNSGFSVGISDLIADQSTLDEIGGELDKLTKEIEGQILQLHTGLFENTSGRSNAEEFEAKVMGTLNKAVGAAGKIGLKSLADVNRMTNMVKAGSKGSDVNVSQMVAVVGQQAIEGKRVPNGFQHRTLPHFKRFDDSARARGFITSSYIKGLQPDEFFFHAMSGREGLIDTAVKTADTGYMQRQIRVALEDLITHHDGSVRDATGNLLEIAYGEDGINATKLEGQPLPIAEFTDERILQEYAAEGAPGAAAYIEAAKQDRRILVENVYGSKLQGNQIQAPVHMDRLIHSIRNSFNLSSDTPGAVTATEVLEAQEMVLNRTHAYNRIWGALVRYYMRPTYLKSRGYTKPALDALVTQIIVKHMKSWVEPGQPVGVIAAQSIGEPATQMTLNTFHLAGVAAKSNMTRGVPRLKELMKVTKNPKAIELTIPLRRDIRDKKEEARRVSHELEFTLLQDIVTIARVYYDPPGGTEPTAIPEDKEWLAYLTEFERLKHPENRSNLSPWVLRFELDRERMFAKNITIDDVVYVITESVAGSGSKERPDVHTQYADYNSSRLVLRVRIATNDPADKLDGLNDLKSLQHKILSQSAVRGIPGLRVVNYQKVEDLAEYENGGYKRVSQYVLMSDGSNFADVLTHPDVDPTRIVSSNVHDMFENLGIEAARATLFKEITTLFAESGSSVNYRHVRILVDKMCSKGRLMSIDRYGINKNDIGPLAKMSFEQTEDIALRAATFGERDPVLGVSSRVMLGAPIRAGTAFSELLYDEDTAMKIDMPEQGVRPKRAPAPYGEEEVANMIYGRDDEPADDDCALDAAALHVNVPVVRPDAMFAEEEDETDVEIKILD